MTIIIALLIIKKLQPSNDLLVGAFMFYHPSIIFCLESVQLLDALYRKNLFFTFK